MTLGEIVQGEGRLFGFLGANASLGGVRAVSEKAHIKLLTLMPLINDMLVLVQVAVGIATLVYMVIKIKKVLRSKK